MSELSQLSPPLLWRFFDKICSIPHPSYHEHALAGYIIDWAQQHQLWCEQDQVGNILIRKAATPGYEHLASVALQAHLDMVPQKNNETVHDFTQDPIQPYIDGDWVKARGTTLGADNGIGMASALAILADDSIQHGPLEVLLTMTEEAGMEGAFGLQPNWLQSSILINTDSEQEGEIYMGCAGGIDFTFTLPVQRVAAPSHYQGVELILKGLRGGHSGADIHLGLANASKLLTRFLNHCAHSLDVKLCQFTGGNLRNAIPREASATLAIATEALPLLQQAIDSFLIMVKNEVAPKDKNVSLSFNLVTLTEPVLDDRCRDQFLDLLNITPNGVIRNSDVAKGVVETSLNIGIVTLQQQHAEIHCLIRSLIDSGKDYVVEMLHSLGKLAGAHTEASGSYPGWQPDKHSFIMAKTKEIYQKIFNKSPDIQVIHAGLECGLFREPYPHMDMVSIGPTIRGPHSPDEKVHIESVALYWQLLTTLLLAVPSAQ